MRLFRTILLVLVVFGLIAQSGCEPAQKQTETVKGVSEPQPKVQPPAVPPQPEPDVGTAVLIVENPVHDFGNVAPNKQYDCQFNFKNTGDGVLKISRVQSTCGCTVIELAKKEYAPGEESTIKVKFRSPSAPASAQKKRTTSKHLYIHSNDRKNPRFQLTIKAAVEVKVEATPDTMQLSIKEENGGAELITLKSKDDKPFSITSITATKSVMTIPFDSGTAATEFVLQPQVDTEKLKSVPRGTIMVNLTHPECSRLNISFTAPSMFELSKERIVVTAAEPGKPVVKKVSIKSNYGDDIEIESISSFKNVMEVTNQKQLENAVELEITVNTPPRTGKSRYVTDNLKVKLKDGEELTIRCTVMYQTAKK